jgi:hypothetical protein
VRVDIDHLSRGSATSKSEIIMIEIYRKAIIQSKRALKRIAIAEGIEEKD